jgi:aspartyl protease family protein
MRLYPFLLFVALCLTDCAGCSKTGNHRPPRRNQSGTTANQTSPSAAAPDLTDSVATAPQPTLEVKGSGPNEIQMTEDGGVFTIPVQVNGTPMTFIFDTGASLISMSETEAAFMFKQGTITKDDIIGKAKFSDANGDISEGTIVNLRSVQIGNRTLQNVRASVVSGGEAPLLLGQSALAQFGKLSIDYQRKTIAFE